MAEHTATAIEPATPPPAEEAPDRRSRLDGAWFRRNGVYVGLVVLVLVNLVITPHFASTGSLRLQLVQVAPIIVVSLGMAMVIGTGGIDLSVGAVMALTAAVIPLYIGYGTLGAIAAGLIAGMLAGALSGSVISRIGVQPIIATLAVMVGGRGLANIMGGQIKSIRDPGFRELGSGKLLGIPWVVLIAIVVVIAVALLMTRTTFGRQLVAIGGNARAAALAGLPVTRVLTTVYVLSALLAALAGVLLVARNQASDPTRLGQLVELTAITAVVVGGTPLTGGQVRVLGTVAGALLMQLITFTLVAHNITDSVAQMVQAVIVVLAVYATVGTRMRRRSRA
ncbi:Ribose transport system permease protein rbsC [Modestobacter italicus]|uniref:Ribose transport system permease protein rbsC n=1 Tax=Modestobacter italicus (strain DSM 44449 / CECT 9708 / BC 501) TaxID=2732864 RepID=I4ESJ2_MODI5|nr:ABC transporter permease [Modestobacter marinus]CCH86355.1 Ribose transport system permease protein rbsC [Modestobacter marinus]